MATQTKEELIEQLSYLSEDTLERLLFYSKNIIIPDEDVLVNVTMQQMLDKTFELADAHFPQWTDRSTADFGRFMVELIALFSEKDFYYINGWGNENLLSKMTIYSDAFMRAVELGYYPNTSRAAKAVFEFVFGPLTQEYTIPRGMLVADIKGTETYSFTNYEDVVLEPGDENQIIRLELYEGKIIADTYQFDGFNVFINKNSIDTESVDVTIGDIRWKRVRTFGNSTNNSRHFMVLPEDNGSVRIMFGDGNYGIAPAIGETIYVSFSQTLGSAGNYKTGVGVLNKKPDNLDIQSTTLVEASRNGSNPDTLSDLKNKSRNYFTTNFTLNNKPSVLRWLLTQYEVKKAHVNIVSNNIYFRIIPAITSMDEDAILNILKERMQPIITGGYFAQPQTTTRVPISSIHVQAYFLPGFNTATNIQKVKSLISDYTNPYILNTYGSGFKKSELDVLLKGKVEGLQNVTYITINGNVIDIDISAFEVLRKVDNDDITVDAYEV